MNLTVGPLPPAVYWRRRAVVLGVVLLLVILLVSMCGGSGNASKRGKNSAQVPTTASPSPSQSSLPPIIGGPGPDLSASGVPSVTASATVPVAPTTPTAGAGASVDPQLCTDAEIRLSPSVQKATTGSVPYHLNLKIQNISARTCKRDVGAGPQEIHITDGAGHTLWSSDYCLTGSGSDVRTFGPNIVSPFQLNWDGDGDAAGCVKGSVLGPGSYRIVAKLGTKVSDPVAFTIAAGSGVGS
jgi:hypothetical protein